MTPGLCHGDVLLQPENGIQNLGGDFWHRIKPPVLLSFPFHGQETHIVFELKGILASGKVHPLNMHKSLSNTIKCSLMGPSSGGGGESMMP